MKIEKKQLFLREFSFEDLDAFACLMADPEVMRFSLNGPIKDKNQARDYLEIFFYSIMKPMAMDFMLSYTKMTASLLAMSA